MITSVTALAAKPIPAYCHGNLHLITPAQWKHCWDIGYSQPTTTAANAGAFAGHSVAPWAIIAGIIIGLLWLVSRSGSGRTVTSKG